MSHRFPGFSAILALALHAVLFPTLAGAAAGDLDPTFGTAGVVTTPFPRGDGFVSALALQPDGKIVAIGSMTARDDGSMLARYNPDGTLDSSFGTDGTVLAGSATALALQPDGTILALGSALARYDGDGVLDHSFGIGGVVAATSGRALVLQPDGKIVTAGGEGEFVLTRLNADGSLDGSFGTGGTVSTAFRASDDANAVLLQPDGKIVAAGSSESNGAKVDFALARYNANGSLDQSFGTGGKVTTDLGSTGFGESDAFATAVLLQPDGKIVAVGVKQDYGENIAIGYFALARYTASGVLDPTFGVGGLVSTNFGSPSDTYARARAAALQSDGKIVAAGVTGGYTYDVEESAAFALARYTSDGELDASFGTDGRVTTPIGASATATAIGLQPDGKIVAAGTAVDGDENDNVAVARYLAGTVVPTTSTTLPIGCSPSMCEDGDRCSDDVCNSLGQCEHHERPPTDVAGVTCIIANARLLLAGGALCTGQCGRTFGRRLRYAERLLIVADRAKDRTKCEHKARVALHSAESLASRVSALAGDGRILSEERAARLVAEAARLVERTRALVEVVCSGL